MNQRVSNEMLINKNNERETGALAVRLIKYFSCVQIECNTQNKNSKCIKKKRDREKERERKKSE